MGQVVKKNRGSWGEWEATQKVTRLPFAKARQEKLHHANWLWLKYMCQNGTMVNGTKD